MENKTIEIAPIAYMRGRTLKDAFILLDEAQNTTPSQIKMFLTRLGPNSKMIVSGDISQIDLIKNQKSGLIDAIKRLKNVVMIDFVESGIDVIKKSKAVATIVGTAGLEAIILGKPVILFGKHNSFDVVPHAKVVKDQGKLKKYLSDILNKPFDIKKAKSEGAKYLSALVSSSFDFGNYDYINYKKYDKKIIRNASKSLVESLES